MRDCAVRQTRRYILEALRDPATGSILKAIYDFDPNLYRHSVRASVYAVEIAMAHGNIRETEKMWLAQGMLFHDAGKLFLPCDILNKPAKPTNEEWEIIRRHPEYGADLLRSQTDLPEPVIRMVLEHHERADGSGYPHGKKLHEIHPLAMLGGMIDVFDALTSDRPYRPRYFSSKDAWQIMKEQAGLFAPRQLGSFHNWLFERGPARFGFQTVDVHVERKSESEPLLIQHPDAGGRTHTQGRGAFEGSNGNNSNSGRLELPITLHSRNYMDE